MKKEKVQYNIRMYKMRSGETIITNEIVLSNTFPESTFFDTPAEVISKRNSDGPLGFMLYPWTPNELLENSIVTLNKTEIVGEIIPSKSLTNFYMVWAQEELTKLQRFKKIFNAQVDELSRHETKRYRTEGKHQKQQQSPINLSLTNDLIKLFDDPEYGWGDPTISN